MTDIITRTTCRLCGSSELIPLFSLGEQYVSNFVDADKVTAGIRCPIDLIMCRGCSLVQLRHTAPQELLYKGTYWYKSGVTDTMKAALRDVTAAAESRVPLKGGDVVLDLGSNDGTLLRTYSVPGVVRVGVEPATNLADEGAKGIECLINDFWSLEAYKKGGIFTTTLAKVITATGMFYDLESPGDFIRDVAKALAPDGLFIAQLMCLKNMLDMCDIGNFAHEHLEFYSLKSLDYLFGKYGLEIYDLETNSVNGQSYRLYVRHKSDAPISPTVQAAREREQGLDDPATFADFFSRMESNKRACVHFIRTAVACGKQVWIYGASTKGNCIAQYYGLNKSLITAAADRSPAKYGKYLVGSGIPIVSEETFRKVKPDYALVMPYAFLPEFLERESAWRASAGRFLVPLPEFRIV